MDSPRQKLIGALARLEAHRREIEHARGQLRERAVAQRDTVDAVEQGWADHLEHDGGAGYLALRRLQTVQREGHRLDRVEAATRGRTGT